MACLVGGDLNKKKSAVFLRILGIAFFMVLLFVSSFFYFRSKVYSAVTIGGDVYSGGNVNNINVKNKSLISAKDTINIGDAQYRIPGYDQSAYRNIINPTRIETIILGLEKIDHFEINNFTEINDLNINQKNFPEGTIWIKNSGDLVIPGSGVAFNGKGTIIVKNGNLKINGNIEYGANNSNTSVGFIVKGDIEIAESVEKLRGAYFATGEIKIR